MTSSVLDQDLHDAHREGDLQRLTTLYMIAAAESENAGRLDEACFRYTQAYVFALECGAEFEASDIRKKLMLYDREE